MAGDSEKISVQGNNKSFVSSVDCLVKAKTTASVYVCFVEVWAFLNSTEKVDATGTQKQLKAVKSSL